MTLTPQITRAAALGVGLLVSLQAAALAAPESYSTTAVFTPPDQLPAIDVPLNRALAAGADEARELLATVVATPDGYLERRAPTRGQVGVFLRLLATERREMQGLAVPRPQVKVAHGYDPDGARRNSARTESADPELLREGALGLESVIGRDSRTQVVRTADYPFSAVGSIGNYCTGTLIGPHHVLTAGHCVYDIATDQYYPDPEFTPGQDGVTRPFGTVGVRAVLALNGWVTFHRRDYDIAMLILDQDIGEQVGWLGFAVARLATGARVIINGYPADKPEGTMWRAACPLRISQPARLYYGCDTFGGMSGSAVRALVKQEAVVYGVHAYGVDSTGLNGATRINRAFFDVLIGWKRDF